MEIKEHNYLRRFDTLEAGGWMMWNIDDLMYGYLKLKASFNTTSKELYFTEKMWNKTATKQDIKKICNINRKRERDAHFQKLIDSGLIVFKKDEGRYIFQDSELNYKLVPLDLLEYLLNTASKGVIQVYIYFLDKYEWKKKTGGEYFFTKKEIAQALGYSEKSAENGNTVIKKINDILECLIRQGIIEYEEVGVVTSINTPTIRQKLTFVAKGKKDLKEIKIPK